MYTLIRTPDHESYLCERDEAGSLNIWNKAGENLARCANRPESYAVVQAVIQEFRRLEAAKQRQRWFQVLAVVGLLALGVAGVAASQVRPQPKETPIEAVPTRFTGWTDHLR